MSTVLKTEQLNRYLGEGANRVHALRDVDLTAEAGKTYAIMGHSGSGKSTLLYLLGLLDHPDSGTIEIAGKQTGQLSDDARTALRNQYLGFVFQFHFLIKEFTTLENITIPMCKLGRCSAAEKKKSCWGKTRTARKISRGTFVRGGGHGCVAPILRKLAHTKGRVVRLGPRRRCEAGAEKSSR